MFLALRRAAPLAAFSAATSLVAPGSPPVAECAGWFSPEPAKTPRELELERQLTAAKEQLARVPPELRAAVADPRGVSPVVRSKIAKAVALERMAGLNGKDRAGAKVTEGVTLSDVTEAFGTFKGEQILTRTGAYLSEIRETGMPEQISYGFMAGVCSGFALKKVGKGLAGVLGLAYVGLQTMVHFELIEIDHAKMKSVVEGQMDWNGDGVVDGKDAQLMWEHAVEVLGEGLPGNGAFIIGAGIGLRSG